jgi:hypothetical protein
VARLRVQLLVDALVLGQEDRPIEGVQLVAEQVLLDLDEPRLEPCQDPDFRADLCAAEQPERGHAVAAGDEGERLGDALAQIGHAHLDRRWISPGLEIGGKGRSPGRFDRAQAIAVEDVGQRDFDDAGPEIRRTGGRRDEHQAADFCAAPCRGFNVPPGPYQCGHSSSSGTFRKSAMTRCPRGHRL